MANTAVLPPPPRITHRLSFTFSTVRLSTDGEAACRLLRRNGDGERAGENDAAQGTMRFMPGMVSDLTDPSLRVDALARSAIGRRDKRRQEPGDALESWR